MFLSVVPAMAVFILSTESRRYFGSSAFVVAGSGPPVSQWGGRRFAHRLVREGKVGTSHMFDLLAESTHIGERATPSAGIPSDLRA